MIRLKHRLSLTLSQVFVLTLIGLTVLLGCLFYVLLNGSRASILASSTSLRTAVGQRLLLQVEAFRDQAENVANDVERQLQYRLLNISDPDGLQAAMYAQVLNHPDIAEVTFTHADATGDDGSTLLFAPRNRWQISVYRSADSDAIVARRVSEVGGRFMAQTRVYGQAAAINGAPETVADPTTHATFQTLTMLVNLGHLVWSDLHYSELSSAGNGPRRVEVTVQKAIGDEKNFQGVVRVGLLEKQLDSIVRRGAQTKEAAGPQLSHICFLCDAQGRLITPVTPSDRLGLDGDDLRIQSPDLPPQIAAALSSKELLTMTDQATGGTVEGNGKRYLVTFLPFPRTQDWVLGVIGSEESYLGNLIRAEDMLKIGALIVMITILVGGALTLRAVQRGLAQIIGATARMREFDFTPKAADTGFRDVQRVLVSLEQAKTAMRAMGKYVPLDLVRDLYHMNREPVLGGETLDISIMFTDIQGFTTLSESVSTDRLAIAMGHYFEAMTMAIHDHSGTIDKYIGDSVMAFWNAPRPCPDHPIKACAAALACARLTRRVFESADWRGLPPLVTRCGIHHDLVKVGHFGSPDRMNYTAIGDGVNLASRLEGLNKQYGTTLLVSQPIYEAASEHFQFRLLDRVAVKGKKQAVNVYELLGTREESDNRAAITAYDEALKVYWSRDFSRAISILQPHLDDPPSDVLSRRCRMLIDDPPPADWDGVYVSMMK